MHRYTGLSVFLIACNPDTPVPAVGTWAFSGGEVLSSTCPSAPRQGSREYVLTPIDDTSFKLSWPQDEDLNPLFACTTSGADFECPSSFLVGAGFLETDVGIAGTFHSESSATGTFTWTYICAEPPVGVTPELECSDAIGDTCQVVQAMEAVLE